MKNEIINSLQTQKEIYGDELFEILNISTPSVTPSSGNSTKYIQNQSNNQSTLVNNIVEKNEPFFESTSLVELDKKINSCLKCGLGKTRKNFVFGVGNPKADAMLIGEAPGAREDELGEPFVGDAGKLLTDILKAIKMERSDVYIANILKCRPTNNRDPKPEEMELCIPYLFKQIELIKPKIILCLGRIAAQVILNSKLSLTKLRGKAVDLNGIKVMVTYHPAALLRNPSWKRGTWEDVQRFKKLYDELVGN